MTAVKDLIEDFAVWRVLVTAPPKVAADAWTRELEKWDHLQGLRVSKVIGTPKQRATALEKDADVYIISRGCLQWLVEYYQVKKNGWPFDMLVVDELSGFKNPQAKRFRALRKTLPFTKRVVGLTGTPSPNGLIDLWAQIYLLDRGERLGRTLGTYQETFFRPGKRNGFVVYQWEPVKGAQEEIERRLRDLCLSMSAEDYLQLPERIDRTVTVTLSPKERKLYDRMEKESLIELKAEGDAVVALNAAATMTKLLQIANGRVYTEEKNVLKIHDGKLQALEEIIEDATSPVLVFYSFRHDMEAIRERIPEARIMETAKDIEDWNDGSVPVMLVHPASAGYGLNLQAGGHIIVWYGLTWSLELYQQANARLHRQGQDHAVIIHHLIAEGTVDEQVMRALKQKDTGQAALLAALSERSKEHVIY